jgi:NAD(P)-dependent dehydrogenase (short-subunit alcohol dehydrogenase family)
VVGDNRVLYLDLTGSGNETATHLLENGRITIMFCSFDKTTHIMRIYGRGRAIHPRDGKWNEYLAMFPAEPGVRQIMEIDVESAMTSCGYGVPQLEGLEELNARPSQDLEEVVASLRRKSVDAMAAPADVTNRQVVEEMVERIASRFGTIDVLVNNAGGIGSLAAFEDLTDADWQTLFDLNVFSMVRVTRAVLPYMRRHKHGRIINIASESGIQPDPEMPHYNASKAAIINLSKSLSKAFAKDGIPVNTVSPAFIQTPLVDEMLASQAKAKGIEFAEAEAQFLAVRRPHIELHRAGRPEEVAAVCVFLASQAASFITGTNVRVDGGSVASI